MRYNRNMKLYALYGLAAFNFLVLLYTHVGHPVDNAGPVKFRNKNLILFHEEVQLRNQELITDEKNIAVNDMENVPFNRYNSIENISNGSQIFPQYSLLLNPSNKCLDEENDFSDIFLLVLITSSVRNFKQRQAVRETWASRTYIMGKKILPLFLLGVNFGGRQHFVKQVKEEYAEHGDIIMEDFNDTYLNLTLKTIMGFKWMNFYCPTAKYVMKTDDDMFINLNYTVQHLATKPSTLKRFVMGHVIVGSPIRNAKSKWYMPYELYPYSDYPPFASGTCYVMSSDVTKDTYQISRS
ncbi:beta-1,3-galactosyltransferase 1-like, partial [Anneissia japonica]|uniref:beta-1,3-galactosyltransferase 1-like n=1 Tax=Anneissia japonica TaxID=1529436 RepID=UPI00142574FF